eukprot:m.28203 g.28203  ORF g.28203 m.28203 type:complete len:160 (+) comp11813_c0_seq3:674-1153(+)
MTGKCSFIFVKMAQPATRPERIWKLAAPEDFEKLREHGYFASDLDRNDGFVHNSTSAILPTIANRFFHGRKDVLLLEVDPLKCGGDAGIDWRDEAPKPEDIQTDKAILHPTPKGFVHIYLHDDSGNLKGIHPEAIVQQYHLDCRDDGTLVIPPVARPKE